MNDATKRFLAYSLVSTALVLAVYGFLRLAGLPPRDALGPYTVTAAAGMFAAVMAAGIVRRRFDVDRVAGLAAAGAALMGTFFAASKVLDQPLFLLAGFFLGIAVAVFALLKDIDGHVSARTLLIVPMAQIMLFHFVLGA